MFFIALFIFMKAIPPRFLKVGALCLTFFHENIHNFLTVLHLVEGYFQPDPNDYHYVLSSKISIAKLNTFNGACILITHISVAKL